MLFAAGGGPPGVMSEHGDLLSSRQWTRQLATSDTACVDVAAIASSASAAVALSALAFSAWSTRHTLQHQRELAVDDHEHQRALAHDERLRRRWADLYIELLLWIERTLTELPRTDSSSDVVRMRVLKALQLEPDISAG